MTQGNTQAPTRAFEYERITEARAEEAEVQTAMVYLTKTIHHLFLEFGMTPFDPESQKRAAAIVIDALLLSAAGIAASRGAEKAFGASLDGLKWEASDAVIEAVQVAQKEEAAKRANPESTVNRLKAILDAAGVRTDVLTDDPEEAVRAHRAEEATQGSAL